MSFICHPGFIKWVHLSLPHVITHTTSTVNVKMKTTYVAINSYVSNSIIYYGIVGMTNMLAFVYLHTVYILFTSIVYKSFQWVYTVVQRCQMPHYTPLHTGELMDANINICRNYQVYCSQMSFLNIYNMFAVYVNACCYYSFFNHEHYMYMSLVFLCMSSMRTAVHCTANVCMNQYLSLCVHLMLIFQCTFSFHAGDIRVAT